MRNAKNLSETGSRYEIRMAGSGGQGIILAGIILATAAIAEGKYATQSQNYGPESRGGNSTSEVIISDKEIDYPKASQLDILVALTQTACDQNVIDMKPSGLVIADADLVPRVGWRKIISVPFQRIAREAGEERAINLAALGALLAFCPQITRDSMINVISQRLPSTKLSINVKAFDEALQTATNLKSKLKPVDAEESSIWI